jgi:glutathione S-transferase
MAEHVDNPRAPLFPTGATPTLEVRRTIRAPRQRVFDAWTKAEELTRWHAPAPASVNAADVDLRVGGAWQIHMRGADGQAYRVHGTYREIDPPRRLVYTWSWSHDPVDTTVTVEFHERGDATEVVLRHDGLASLASRERHEHGWVGCFAKLGNCV